jgi:hypothetical protein
MVMRLVCLLLLVAGLLPLAAAQAGVGVSPPRVELRAAPGQQLTQAVVVDHPGPRGTLEVVVTLSDVLLNTDGSLIFIGGGSHPRSLVPWLSVTPLQFRLEPQGRLETRYSVQVPPNAEAGTYWGIIFFESEPPAGDGRQGGIGVRTRVRVGHVVYVEVGRVVREGRIAGVRYAPPRRPGGPGEVRIMFQNTGNGLVRLGGTVEIRNLDGELLQTLEVSNAVSFPGATHEIAVALGEYLAPGSYLVLAALDYGEATVVAGEGRITVP